MVLAEKHGMNDTTVEREIIEKTSPLFVSSFFLLIPTYGFLKFPSNVIITRNICAEYLKKKNSSSSN